MGMAATGRNIDFAAVFVGEVSGGKLSHWQAYFDTGTMMRQLGVGGCRPRNRQSSRGPIRSRGAERELTR